MIARPLTDDESRWSAVLDRDAAADGRFVYAVASTGVYCRPSCPSRRPRRSQVSFFPTSRDAEAAGFRACRRCAPGRDETDARRRVREAREYLESHPDDTVTLDRLASVVGLSPYHLQRSFKRTMGLSPKAYAARLRMDRMKAGLRQGESVTRATFEAGYTSLSRVYEEAPSRLGMTPGEYRRGGQGVHIRYTVVDTDLGALLVAATDLGVCSVKLGDDPAALTAELRREYDAAAVEPDDAELAGWAGEVVRRLEGEESGAIPLDVRGTAFQHRVWEALQRIPAGATRSYSQIALDIGHPTAARAVAGACADNRVAVVIPCHRVVREDGELGGYRWGVERKLEILRREGAELSRPPAGEAAPAPARRTARASSPR
jgi:AraC family transcriptional regulator, regulatory protein of adaptative response / methylated-DNA-[protein]-cysteine methyltransferase